MATDDGKNVIVKGEKSLEAESANGLAASEIRVFARALELLRSEDKKPSRGERDFRPAARFDVITANTNREHLPGKAIARRCDVVR